MRMLFYRRRMWNHLHPRCGMDWALDRSLPPSRGDGSCRKPILLERHHRFRYLLQNCIWLLVFVSTSIGYSINWVYIPIPSSSSSACNVFKKVQTTKFCGQTILVGQTKNLRRDSTNPWSGTKRTTRYSFFFFLVTMFGSSIFFFLFGELVFLLYMDCSRANGIFPK